MDLPNEWRARPASRRPVCSALWAASAITPRPGARDCDLRTHGGGVASWGSFEATRRAALGALAGEPRYFVGVDLGPDGDRGGSLTDPAAVLDLRLQGH